MSITVKWQAVFRYAIDEFRIEFRIRAIKILKDILRVLTGYWIRIFKTHKDILTVQTGY